MTAPQLTDYTQGIGTVSADMLNTFMQTCDNFTQLRAFPGNIGIEVLARGQAYANDGAGGIFYWNSTATGPDDNLNVIVPQSGVAGAWIRQSFFSLMANFYAIDTGTANAMIGAYSPTISAYTDGTIYYVRPRYNNSAATTFNGGPGALPVVGPAGAMQGGEIIAGQTLGLQYSALNSNFFIVSGWGAVQVGSPTGSHQALQNGGASSGYAALNGSSTEVFNVEAGTTGTEAVNYSQFDGQQGSTPEGAIPGGPTFIIGSFSATANSNGTVTIANGGFPTSCVAVFLQADSVPGTNNSLSANPTSKTQFNWSWPSTVGGSFTINYLAIGF